MTSRTNLEKTWIHFLIATSVLFKSVPLRHPLDPPAKVSPLEIHNPVPGLAQILRTMAKSKFPYPSLKRLMRMGLQMDDWCFFLNLLENRVPKS